MHRPNYVRGAGDFKRLSLIDLPLDEDLYARSPIMDAEMLYSAALTAGAYPMGIDADGNGIWDWHLPEKRAVIKSGTAHMSKTTQQQANKADWNITHNAAFGAVVDMCRGVPRKEDEVLEEDEEVVEWLDHDTSEAYKSLANNGLAYSIEVWNGPNLVGGLFGLLFSTYCTVESMFSLESGASKTALIVMDTLCTQNDKFIDCQEWSDHLGTLGAVCTSSKDFHLMRSDAVAARYITGIESPHICTSQEAVEDYRDRVDAR